MFLACSYFFRNLSIDVLISMVLIKKKGVLDKYGKHYHVNKTTRKFTKSTNRIGREPWMTAEILTDIRKRDRQRIQKSQKRDS